MNSSDISQSRRTVPRIVVALALEVLEVDPPARVKSAALGDDVDVTGGPRLPERPDQVARQREVPTWSTPNWVSKPSAVSRRGMAIVPASLPRTGSSSWSARKPPANSRPSRGPRGRTPAPPGRSRGTSASVSSRARSPRSTLRQAMTMVAPARANARDPARPMPEFAPVTTTVRSTMSGTSAAAHASLGGHRSGGLPAPLGSVPRSRQVSLDPAGARSDGGGHAARGSADATHRQLGPGRLTRWADRRRQAGPPRRPRGRRPSPGCRRTRTSPCP